MAKIGDAFVEIGARTSKFQAGIARVRERFQRSMQGMTRMARRAGIAIGAALGAGIGLSLRAAAKQEESEARLAAVLRATGNAAGFTATQLKEQASALQQLTSVGDESIINTQAIIATFKEVKGDEFKRTTQAALDMAAVLQQDTRSAAIQLGKALNDPIKGITALSRSGVSFTEQQKEQIKTLTKSGKVVEAQGIILRELESEFGGAAEAIGGKLGGSFSKLKNDMGDALEEFGKMIFEGLNLRNVFARLQKRMQGMGERLKELRDNDWLGRQVMQAKLFFNTIKTVFAKVSTVVLGVWNSIKESVRFTGESIGVFMFNAAMRIQTVFLNMKDNVVAFFKALWHKITHPKEEFQLPNMKKLTEGLQSKLVDGPDAPTKAFDDMYKQLATITAEGEARRQKIEEAFAKRSIKRAADRAAAAKAEAEEAARAAAAAAAGRGGGDDGDDDDKKTKKKAADLSTVQFADLIAKAQASVMTSGSGKKPATQKEAEKQTSVLETIAKNTEETTAPLPAFTTT